MWLGLLIGLIIGANLSLFLYAIILSGKKADEKFYNSDEFGGMKKWF